MEQPSSKALFTPAKTQRASEAIYNQIYPKIISGELRPGDRLPPERELAEMFQRSRAVVREALRMLQQEGLIGISPTAAAPVWLPSTTRRRMPRRSGRPWRARRPTWTASSASRSMMWRSTALWPRPATTRWPL